MNFEFSDEQRLLKDSIDRLLADKYGAEDRRRFSLATRIAAGLEAPERAAELRQGLHDHTQPASR